MFETAFKSALSDERLANEYWQEIEEKYTSPTRFYHTIDHLDFLYTQLLPVKQRVLDWPAILFAIAWHDFEYDVMRDDNEERSAEIATKRLQKAGLLTEVIQSCADHILATQHHKVAPENDTNLFTDADLAILGSISSTYKYYVDDIRKEYANFPEELFKTGRKNVLQYYIGMDFIFKTEHFREKFEKQARENIATELKALK
jgi:predicted metal-dependent HD superfamily phosphohydrolase